MTINKINFGTPGEPPKDLHRTVPVAPVTRTQPVDIPGVLDQTRRLYQPYAGTTNKDNK
jgi:hypothetical protein